MPDSPTLAGMGRALQRDDAWQEWLKTATPQERADAGLGPAPGKKPGDFDPQAKSFGIPDVPPNLRWGGAPQQPPIQVGPLGNLLSALIGKLLRPGSPLQAVPGMQQLPDTLSSPGGLGPPAVPGGPTGWIYADSGTPVEQIQLPGENPLLRSLSRNLPAFAEEDTVKPPVPGQADLFDKEFMARAQNNMDRDKAINDIMWAWRDYLAANPPHGEQEQLIQGPRYLRPDDPEAEPMGPPQAKPGRTGTNL